MKRLLRLFKPREREVIQETSTSSLLQTLPTEVLLVIVDHMSLEDAGKEHITMSCGALCRKIELTLTSMFCSLRQFDLSTRPEVYECFRYTTPERSSKVQVPPTIEA